MKINVGRVRDYLIATLENTQDHASESPELMHLIAQMDGIFHDEIFSLPLSEQSAANLLIINAYTMLLAGVREALSGHVVCVFPIVRAALESSCYAYIIANDASKADVWLDRHSSETALSKCRKMFTAKKAVDILKSSDPVMAEYVWGYYEASIDFGAHPNTKSVIGHLSNSGPAQDGLHAFEFTSVYGKNSWHVNHALFVCVEAGQAIAYLIAASIDNHPLIHERGEIFQSWVDAKNRMVEELTGEPCGHTGPVYSSVRPPL
ncbi:hypothetical protein RTH46_09035 [Pseudomonas sp. zfem004]|uniref:hypothetical protein n=1 Tax=Pseudomonas sp. zfem004 TaxID=3078199 RepID=UPI002928E214|nr:hypothetical protein [Pseudomonas sp. zfem004]MDU9402635.1 hypothetical protein [Pseudomonas sp. zfem004]